MDIATKTCPREHPLIAESFELIQLLKNPKADPSFPPSKSRLSRFHRMDFIINPYDTTVDDFICVVYWLEDYKIRVKIYRLDSENGWVQSLKLRITGDNFCEYIYIGASPSNLFENDFMTRNKISPRPTTQFLIPKTIIQTGYPSQGVLGKNTIDSFLDLNPDFEHLFFDNNACIEFFKQEFPQYLEYYLRLRPGAYRADLFRYCYLYRYGGCYFDHKLICRKPLEDYITPEDTLLLCADWDYNLNLEIFSRIYNAVLFVVPEHKLFKLVIETCIENIRNRHYHDGVFAITGPDVLYDCYRQIYGQDNQFIPFKHIAFLPWNHRNMLVIHKKEKSVLLNKSMTMVYNPKLSEYHKMWEDRTIYYHHVQKISNRFYWVSMNPPTQGFDPLNHPCLPGVEIVDLGVVPGPCS